MHTKVVFFDLYQTLISVDVSKEDEGKKAGFEKIIIPYLLRREISESKAGLALSYYSDELRIFYKDYDIGLFQHSFSDILAKVFNKYYSLVLPESDMGELIYEFRKVSRGYLSLYEGAREALEALSSRYTLAVASHTQSIYTERELKELDIFRYFRYRIYSSDIGFKKKSNNFYQKCLEVVGLDPKDCVMVGDNLYEDIYMANRNGMHTVWIMNHFTKDRNKAEVEPDASLSIQSLRDLPSVIKKILD